MIIIIIIFHPTDFFCRETRDYYYYLLFRCKKTL